MNMRISCETQSAAEETMMDCSLVEGTAAMALFVGVFVAVIFDYLHFTFRFEYSNQIVAFVLASLLHIMGTKLLHDLEYKRHYESETPQKPPLETFNIQHGEIANISDVTASESEDSPYKPCENFTTSKPSGNEKMTELTQEKKADPNKDTPKGDEESSHYVSVASISTVAGSVSCEDDIDYHETLECFYGISFPLGVFFLCTILLSSALIIASLSQQVSELSLATSNSPYEWTRATFVLTLGFFVASNFLSHYKRYFAASFDSDLLDSPWTKLCLSGLLAIVTSFFLQQAVSVRNNTLGNASPYLVKKPYYGEAWVTEAQVADEDAYCQNVFDSIPVNLTVVYGGDWACPGNPSQLCEDTITTQLECSFTEQVPEDDAYDEPEWLTPEQYVDMRYHDYGVDDDAAYDYDEQPSFSYWNRPTDFIFGSCDGSCSVQSESWAWDQNRTFARSGHGMFLCFGMSLCFLGWPLYEGFRLIRQTCGVLSCGPLPVHEGFRRRISVSDVSPQAVNKGRSEALLLS